MKILIADDHSLVREGLRTVLSELAPGSQVHTAASLPDALALAKNHSDAAVLLLDLNMPGMQGPASVATVCETLPLLPVIVLSGSEAYSDVQLSLANGAMGYVPKSASPDTLFSAIRQVLNGEIYTPNIQPTANKGMGGRPRLTTRQLEVLKALSNGQPNKLIARALDISEGTVKSHIDSILTELGAQNRTHAVIVAQQQGIL